jgi:hypothetical protein
VLEAHPFRLILGLEKTTRVVRYPGHTIQFLNYGYTEYIRKALELLEIDINNLEMKKYETWTPYSPSGRQD